MSGDGAGRAGGREPAPGESVTASIPKHNSPSLDAATHAPRSSSTVLYRAIVAILDRRIRSLRWPMHECDDRSGLQDGYTAKLLHPDTASGRQARWESLQLLIDALYPQGFVISMRASAGIAMRASASKINAPVPARASMYVPTPEQAREMARMRWQGVPEKRRRTLARRAANTRWSRHRSELADIRDGAKS